MFLSRRDNRRLDLPLHDCELDQRCSQSRARGSRTAGINNEAALEALDLGNVRVPVDDRIAIRKVAGESERPPLSRAWIVHQTDADASYLCYPAPRQRPFQRKRVHVAGHGFEWSQLRQLLEHRQRDEITGVQNQVGSSEPVEAPAGKSSTAAQVSVREAYNS